MTTEEFRNRRHHNDRVVIHVLAQRKGPAQAVLSNNDFHYVLCYKTFIRDNITPDTGYENTISGAQYNKVYNKIKDGIKRNGLRVEVPPPPKMNRIVVASNTAQKVKSDAERRKVAKHLCHSTATSERYYEFSNYKDALEAHEIIQTLKD